MRTQLPVLSPLSWSSVLAMFARGDARPAASERVRAMTGVARVVLTESGTGALTRALRLAAARRPGAPCVLPAFGCFDLATAALGAGVPVALYDLDPHTLAPEPASLASALEGGAAALVAVHQFGLPVPLDALRAAADAAGALLIEDAAQGIGGSWRGIPLGATGDLGILSFGRGKGATGGVGGALLFRTGALHVAEPLGAAPDGLVYEARLGLVLAGQWLLGRPSLYAIPSRWLPLGLGETHFRSPSPVCEIPAGAARVLLRSLPGVALEASTRGRNALRVRAVVERAIPESTVAVAADSVPSWLRSPIRLASPRGGSETATRLGIARSYPLPLDQLPALRPALVRGGRFPGAAALTRELLTLPTHSMLTERDLVALERWVEDQHG